MILILQQNPDLSSLFPYRNCPDDCGFLSNATPQAQVTYLYTCLQEEITNALLSPQKTGQIWMGQNLSLGLEATHRPDSNGVPPNRSESRSGTPLERQPDQPLRNDVDGIGRIITDLFPRPFDRLQRGHRRSSFNTVPTDGNMCLTILASLPSTEVTLTTYRIGKEVYFCHLNPTVTRVNASSVGATCG
ncbi:MAG: hypothetical protein SVV80_02845 [Planctomycetota bacterium]|nr:hypothetical protein [Planctomycetota bacterium]